MTKAEQIAEIAKVVNGYPAYSGEPVYIRSENDAGGHSHEECYDMGVGDGESLLADKIKQILNS